MELLTQLMTFFGVNMLESGATFPDMLQWLFSVLISVYLILTIFKFFFSMVWQLQNGLR